MKNLITICLLAITVTSCTKKTTSIRPFGDDAIPVPISLTNNFVFGEYDYPHLSNNIPLYTFYFKDSTKVYREAKYFYPMPVAHDLFSTTMPLHDTAYNIVRPLITNFPPYLLAHPNTIIGATPNVPATMLYIATVRESDTTTWNINMDTTKLPADIRVYATQVQAAWDSLRNIH